jgi:hypothetical protein
MTMRRLGSDMMDPSNNEELHAMMNRDVAGRNYSLFTSTIANERGGTVA